MRARAVVRGCQVLFVEELDDGLHEQGDEVENDGRQVALDDGLDLVGEHVEEVADPLEALHLGQVLEVGDGADDDRDGAPAQADDHHDGRDDEHAENLARVAHVEAHPEHVRRIRSRRHLHLYTD